MSADAQAIQIEVDKRRLLFQNGLRYESIILDAQDYTIAQSINIDFPVRIIGNSASLRCTAPDIRVFDLAPGSGRSRIEDIEITGFVAPAPAVLWDGALSCVGFDVRAGLVSIERCTLRSLRIGIYLHSKAEDNSALPPEPGGPANANGFLVEGGLVSQCVTGIWTAGRDAQAGVVNRTLISGCRRGVFEDSFFGNTYSSILVEACPHPDDPHRVDGFGIRVGQVANYSTFIACYIEDDSKAFLQQYCLTLGGALTRRVDVGERVGGWASALVFLGPGENANPDRLFVGGAAGASGQPNIATMYRNNETPQSQKMFGYRTLDGWRLRP